MRKIVGADGQLRGIAARILFIVIAAGLVVGVFVHQQLPLAMSAGEDVKIDPHRPRNHKQTNGYSKYVFEKTTHICVSKTLQR